MIACVCSIMADMLAGQLYAHACGLSSLVLDSSTMSSSCLNTIYQHNVIQFAEIASKIPVKFLVLIMPILERLRQYPDWSGKWNATIFS